MAEHFRFGDYQHELGYGHDEVSFNALTPKLQRDLEGRLIPYQPTPIKLMSKEVFKLLQPYVSVRFMEQVKSVIPLALYLALFQILILRQLVEDSWVITGGLFAVIVGLMFFMEGLKLGLMPFGTVIGKRLPQKSPLPMVLFITLLLGIGVTFAEPAIGALKAAGQKVAVERAPYLFALLNDWSELLVLVIGFSVGFAAVIGTLRFLYGWSLKPLIYISLGSVLGLTLYGAFDPELTKILGLAWDAGAVTTGPVTVPLVLFLFVLLRLVLKETLKNMGEIVYGIGLTIIGMCLFNAGLTYGLSKLGGNVGSLVPAAFMELSTVPLSPLYIYVVGLVLSLVFAFGLGYGATVAEPALNALGTTAQSLTNGVFKKKTLIAAVSLGVAIGIAIGLAKLIFNLPLVWLIMPGYVLALVLTYFSSETFVNVAWDSAGVTTGPITVPLVLAMGLGFGNATNAVEGFGILSMASIGPILTVLATGLLSDYNARNEALAVTKASGIPHV
ncbi:MAG: DUF1538 domain-containing protein [Nitrospirales bacterium]|nr:DUF1538 domain-containing protein [Nitrospirales bacterium]